MIEKTILIIEDNALQLEQARQICEQKGYAVISASTLADATVLIPQARGILSDLYFPFDTEQHRLDETTKKDYLSTSVNLIRAYQERRCPPLDSGANCVRSALGAWQELFGLPSLEAVLEYDLFKKTSSPVIYKAAVDAVRGRTDYDVYLKLQELATGISTESHLPPSGMFVRELAQKHNKPVVVVTSEYHHGLAFEPFAQKIGNYVDTVKENGLKDWAIGLENLERVMSEVKQ
jgi:CheY-like chemotaxis protein